MRSLCLQSGLTKYTFSNNPGSGKCPFWKLNSSFQGQGPVARSATPPPAPKVFPPNLGFCRLALKHGTDMLPIYVFGRLP